jgi:hypothetical protein
MTFFDAYALGDADEEPSLSVFEDESIEVQDSVTPQSLYNPVAISESTHAPQFLSDLHVSLKSLRKAVTLSPLLQLNPETLALLHSTHNAMNELCLKVAVDAENQSLTLNNALSNSSSPIDYDMLDCDRNQPLVFPDYSSVLRAKTPPVPPMVPVKVEKEEPHAPTIPQPTPGQNQPASGDITFTTLTFTDDGGVIVPDSEVDAEPMGPPKSRKTSKRNPKTPYADHLKTWRNQPYGPRQLKKNANDLMMEFIVPTQSSMIDENSDYFIAPPAAHTYNRQLN